MRSSIPATAGHPGHSRLPDRSLLSWQKFFKYFGIPQVVGYIVFGLLLGTSFLNIVTLELSNELIFISEIALGLIGFDMGSHLRFKALRKLGRSISVILIFESLGTFTLVNAEIYALTSS